MDRGLIGKAFGNLLVLRKTDQRTSNRSTVWECQCSCGNVVLVSRNSLVTGHTTSCGCLRKEFLSQKKPSEKHGAARTKEYGGKERLYRVWLGMRERCNNPNHKKYMQYGGRGVKVCTEWDDYTAFRSCALSHGYDPGAPRGKCTIDRIDVNKGYSPNNCRFVDMREQRLNQRRMHHES